MPDHCRQRPRSCRSVRLARTRTANLVVHRPIHRFVPTPTPVLRAKAIASTAPARPPSDQRCGQFAIALAAPSVPCPPQFRALALFGRRPPERVVGIVGAGIRKPAHKLTSTFYKGELSYQTHSLFLTEHAGTHFDVPYHFNEHGRAIHDYTPDELLVPAKLLDLTHKRPMEPIGSDDLET